ncbi:unnamed protein product, partial [Tenebrio molitor]
LKRCIRSLLTSGECWRKESTRRNLLMVESWLWNLFLKPLSVCVPVRRLGRWVKIWASSLLPH